MAATKAGVFLEQALLQVVAQFARLVVHVVGPGVVVGPRHVRQREPVDLAVGEQHVVQGLALVLRRLGDHVGRPGLFDLETLGELHELPQVRLRLARRRHLLPPELGTAFGVAVGTFLLGPHRGRQDQVGRQRGYGRVRVGNHDEGLGVAPAGIGLVVGVRASLHVVVAGDPVALELAVLEHPALQHRVVADLAVEEAFRQFPDLLGDGPVLGFRHDQIGRQAVGEGADLACRAAGGGLAGQRERSAARLRDLAGEQMDVVDHVVGPAAAGVLVEAHGPVRHHLLARVGIQLGQAFELLGRYAGQLGDLLDGVFGYELGVLLEADRFRTAGLGGVLGGLLARIVWPQTVADVGIALAEVGVLGDELGIDRLVLDDVVGDVVEDRQVGLRREDHAVVGQFERPVLEGRQHVHLAALVGQPPIGQARPQDRVHLGHVRPPQHEGVGVLEVVVAAHRLVDAEGAYEAGDCRCHAMAGIGVDVVGAEAGLPQLGRGVAFPHRPLSRAEHADRRHQLAGGLALIGFQVLGQGGLPFLGHDVEGLIPADRRELAVLRVLAVLHAQQRLGQAIVAIHDLGQEVALDAVQSAIDRGVRVPLGADHAAVLHTDQHRTAGAAEAAGGLVPANVGGHRIRGLGDHGDRDAGRGCRRCDRVGLDELASIHAHGHASWVSRPSSVYS